MLRRGRTLTGIWLPTRLPVRVPGRGYNCRAPPTIPPGASAKGPAVHTVNSPIRWSLIVLWLNAVAGAAEPAAEVHPLQPVLQMARDGLQRIDRDISDYTCLLAKRERIDGRLGDTESMRLKVRHQRLQDGRVVVPFSVYVEFLQPERVRGREVLYVQGANQGKLIVRNGGGKFGYITTALLPDSRVAMQESRYPITEIGMRNLTSRLIEQGIVEARDPECLVKKVPGAKINGRPCLLIEVAHPHRHPQQTYQFAHIFIDDALQLPVRYAAYDWPEKEGGLPRLLEEYTYTNIQTNVGLSDWDFDHRNENYHFLKSFKP